MKAFLTVLAIVILLIIIIEVNELTRPAWTMTPSQHSQEYYAHKTCDLAMQLYNKNPTKANEDFAHKVCDE